MWVWGIVFCLFVLQLCSMEVMVLRSVVVSVNVGFGDCFLFVLIAVV